MISILDLETVSAADLKEVGSENYAAHESTLISVLCFKWLNEDKVYRIYNPKLGSGFTSEEALTEFRTWLNTQNKIIAHNAVFEEDILNACLEDLTKNLYNGFACTRKYFYNDFIDTQVLSNMAQAPPSLAAASEFFNLDVKKDLGGKNIMLAVCKSKKEEPKKLATLAAKIPSTWVKVNGYWSKAGLEVYDRMGLYCETDVLSTELLFKKLSSKGTVKNFGTFKDEEKMGMNMAATMNDRGVLTDSEWLEKLSVIYDDMEEESYKHCMSRFGLRPSQRVKLKVAFQESGKVFDDTGKEIAHGLIISGTSKDHIAEALANPLNMDSRFDEVKEFLVKFLELNKSALKKIRKAKVSVNSEGVLRNLFRYRGATATGRFTSFGVQLQNLPRVGAELEHCKGIISGKTKEYTNDDVVSSIRGCFIPRPGYKFFIADLSQIEARAFLHKAGDYDRIKNMSEGSDEYSVLAASLLKKDLSDITKKDRQIGKVFFLALGYGLGQDKFMADYEKSTGEIINLADALALIERYKLAFPGIFKQHKRYKQLIQIAVQNEEPFRVKLDSGRYLNYGKLSYREIGSRRELVYYNGVSWRGVYGAKVFQNTIQAECADILLIKMNDLHRKGAKIVMQIHDEVVVEVPENMELDKATRMWDNAGRDKIKELFPKLIINSKCVFTERYWEH